MAQGSKKTHRLANMWKKQVEEEKRVEFKEGNSEKNLD